MREIYHNPIHNLSENSVRFLKMLESDAQAEKCELRKREEQASRLWENTMGTRFDSYEHHSEQFPSEKWYATDQPNTAETIENNGETEQQTEKPTSEKITETQRRAVEKAFEKIARGELLTEQEKGNLTEMMMDLYYIGKGYEPCHERVTSLNDKGHQGIDGVYKQEDEDGKPKYVIADAKYDTSKLSTTVDGTKQMSDAWIDKRLDPSVGKEMADDIRNISEDNPQNVQHEVYHYSPDKQGNGGGVADICSVDSDGNLNQDKRIVESYDTNGFCTSWEEQ